MGLVLRAGRHRRLARQRASAALCADNPPRADYPLFYYWLCGRAVCCAALAEPF